jgi:hypothetical protein
MAIPNYLPPRQFSETYPAFPLGGVHHKIFHGKENGLEKTRTVVRDGRKVLINVEYWFRLIEIKNTGEYESVIRLIDAAADKGRYLPLQDAIVQVRQRGGAAA